MKKILLICILALSIACNNQTDSNFKAKTKQKIGVLLVNHGSHSPTWRGALLDLDSAVRTDILSLAEISDVKTAFMEYNEPSIATRMKEFDDEGYTDVIIVPVFLTVSSHSFDDIPTIIGTKEDPTSLEHLKIEKISTYKAQANTYITPLLDFTDILQKNLFRRISSLSKDTANEGVVFIAYGDETYDTEWSNLMDSMGQYIHREVGISTYSYGWCGHIAHYDPMKTTAAIEEVLDSKSKAIVIPVLVAHDEMFQISIIGDGIKNIQGHNEKVIYRPDAILPDPNVEAWVYNAVKAQLKTIPTDEE